MNCVAPNCNRTAVDGTARCAACAMTGAGMPGPNDPMRFAQGRRQNDKPEFSGGNVDYYRVHIAQPKRPEVPAYTVECEDIIEALNMTFAEGCAFKAIWRSAAARTLGLKKQGQDEHGVYDAEKVTYYGQAMLRQRKRLAAKEKA